MTDGQAQGTVTVLFTDVEGSTALRTSRGDEAAHDLLSAHEETVRAQIARHDGREIKSTGDGFMAAFASARKAVGCAVGIQRALQGAELRVRIGLNAGEVTERDGDLFGEAVNAAARIMAKARGAEILASDVVRHLAGTMPEVTFADRGRFRLKGFPDRWHLYEIGWRPEAPATTTVPLAERTGFVGRQAERAELVRLVDRAVAGRGALVLVGGEPGVGKSRLAEEVRVEAERRGMRTRLGRCYEEGAPPYTPFVEMLEAATHDIPLDLYRQVLGEDAGEIARIMPRLREIFADIPPPLELPPESERRYLLNALRAFIGRAAAVRPQFLVLDDIHWADEPTLLVLRHIAEQVHEMAVLAVGTYRDVELDVARPLAKVLDDLHRQRLAHRVSLKRLLENEVASMIATLAGQDPPPALVRAIYAETEGNPFFVEEVFRHLQEEGRLLDAEGRFRAGLDIGELDVPEGVRLVIGRRLERLGEATRKVLAAAAVVGHGFTFELLEALGETDPDSLLDAIDEAERAQLVVSEEGREGRLSFAHELIRQTLLARLSLPRRQRLHVRVAEAMERLGVAAEQASDTAHHLYQAGAAADPAKTAHYLALAGERALEAVAFEDALVHLERALSLAPPEDEVTRALLLGRLGFAQRSAGRLDEAIATWSQALDAHERLGDAEAVGRLAHVASQQLTWTGRFVESVQMSSRGLAALGDAETGDRSRTLCRAGLTISLGGAHDAGEEMIREGQEIADRLGGDDLRGLALYYLGVHEWAWGRMAKALLALSTAIELLAKTGQRWDLANAAGFLGLTLLNLGRVDEALALADEQARLAERIGNRNGQFVIQQSRAILELARSGDIAAWRRFAEAGLELAVGAVRSNALAFLGVAEFWAGRWDEALALFDDRAEFPGVFGGGSAGRVLIMAYSDDRSGALEWIAAHSDQFAEPGRPNAWSSWNRASMATEALYVLGEYEQAAALSPALEDGVTVLGRAGVRFPDGRLITTVAGMAAAAGARWETAEEHFRSALREAQERPRQLEEQDVCRFYAQMLIERGGTGDHALARQLLQGSIDAYRALGMPRHAQLSEALLTRTSG